jgi:hypothetical protein
MPLIIPANSITGGYEVDNSLRFDDGSSDSLSHTQSTPTNADKITFSFWVKLADTLTGGGDRTIIGERTDANNQSYLYFRNDQTLGFYQVQSGSTNFDFRSTRVFRDQSAWYNIVVLFDTAQATSTNRFKIYVNNEEITNWNANTYPSQNDNVRLNGGGETLKIGGDLSQTDCSFYLAEFVYCDGQALDPTSFGEFDEDSGIWKPKAVSGLTFGTNGFYLDFENSGSLGADVSGNGNNFTVNNLTSIDQTTDTPTNNFCTMSTPTWFDGTKANGGLTISTNQTSYRYQPSSIGVSSGKWYWEIKLTTLSDYALMGITDAASPIQVGTNWILGSGAYDYSVVYNTAGGNGHKYNNAGTSPTNTPGAFMGGFAQGNIVMFALDCDNNTLKIGVNDSWSNGSGSTNQTFSTTTAISITASASTNTGVYFPAVGDYGGATSVFDLNFGNAPYTISSGNSDGNSRGNFEYEVPDGYFALCTSNLAEHG